MVDYEAFQRELQTLFEKHDVHGIMVIPHYIMVEYLTTCRRAFETALSQLELENEKWRMEANLDSDEQKTTEPFVLRRRRKEEIRKLYGLE